jgi:hypothetical protein
VLQYNVLCTLQYTVYSWHSRLWFLHRQFSDILPIIFIIFKVLMFKTQQYKIYIRTSLRFQFGLLYISINARSLMQNTLSNLSIYQGGHANFFLLVRQSKIRKFSGSFRNRKSANFVGVPVRKSQIQNLWWLIRQS